MQSLKYVGVALTAGCGGCRRGACSSAPASGRDTRKRLGRRFDEESRRMGRTLREEKDSLIRRDARRSTSVADYVSDEAIDSGAEEALEGRPGLERTARRHPTAACGHTPSVGAF